MDFMHVFIHAFSFCFMLCLNAVPCCAAQFTVALKVQLTVPPDGKVVMAKPASNWAMVGLAGPVAAGVPEYVQLTAPVLVRVATAGSAKIVPPAAAGPEFDSVMV